MAVHARSPGKQSDLAVACTGVTRSRSRHLISQLTNTDPIGDFVRGRDLKLRIGGDLVDAATRRTYETVDPSTGERLTDVPDDGSEDVLIRAEETRLAMLDAIDGGMPFESLEEYGSYLELKAVHVRLRR